MYKAFLMDLSFPLWGPLHHKKYRRGNVTDPPMNSNNVVDSIDKIGAPNFYQLMATLYPIWAKVVKWTNQRGCLSNSKDDLLKISGNSQGVRIMKVIHRFGFVATDLQKSKLESFGVKVPPGIVPPGGTLPLIAFDLAENHPNWDEIQNLLNKWGVSTIFMRTEFSKKETESSSWLKLYAWHHGYPQPKDDEFGYLEATYDLKNRCEKCGLGKKQKAAFQMKGEPKWGRRGMMQLTWVYDQIFVSPQVWQTVFKPHGIECRPVLNRKLQELKTVVQLVADEEVHVDTTNLTFDVCPSCQRKKYLPPSRGFFPSLKSKPDAAMVRTAEEFGSGGASNHGVLISQKIRRELVEKKVRGPWFGVVACS